MRKKESSSAFASRLTYLLPHSPKGNRFRGSISLPPHTEHFSIDKVSHVSFTFFFPVNPFVRLAYVISPRKKNKCHLSILASRILCPLKQARICTCQIPSCRDKTSTNKLCPQEQPYFLFSTLHARHVRGARFDLQSKSFLLSQFILILQVYLNLCS